MYLHIIRPFLHPQLSNHEIHDSNDGNQAFVLRQWQGKEIVSASGQSVHLLEDRLVAGEITACYGAAKAGKTFLAVSLVLAAALDLEFWGKKFSNNGAPVVYFAAERVEQAALRIRAAVTQLGLTEIPDNIVLIDGRSKYGLGSDSFETVLRATMCAISPVLVIFDTYARMADNNEDSARDATDNVAALERIIMASRRSCAGVIVHHSGKEASRGMRGSSGFLAAVTTAWKVEKAGYTLTLSMEEANAFATCKPQHFLLQSATVTRSATDQTELRVGVAVPSNATSKEEVRGNRIVEVWEGSEALWRSMQDVRIALLEQGLTFGESTIHRALAELVKSGRLESKRAGKRNEYRIKVTEDENH